MLTGTLVRLGKFKQSIGRFNMSITNLNAEQRHALNNRKAAVDIWRQLSERGNNPEAKTKFEALQKEYEVFCAQMGIGTEFSEAA